LAQYLKPIDIESFCPLFSKSGKVLELEGQKEKRAAIL